MSELFKIFLTSSLTIIGGVIIYVSGQILLKFFIEPIHEQKKTIGEIADTFNFYVDLYLYPERITINKKVDASESFRNLAKLLISRTYIIPFYNFIEKLKLVKRKSAIEEASSKMIEVSNLINKYVSEEKLGRINNHVFLPDDGIQNEEIVDKVLKIQSLLGIKL